MILIFEDDADELVVVVDGTKIAKRGRPNTPEGGTWVSTEPGWAVRDNPDGELIVEYDGAEVD
jgi:hypothetical protein